MKYHFRFASFHSAGRHRPYRRNLRLGAVTIFSLLLLTRCAPSVPLATEATPPGTGAEVAVARFLVDIDGLEADEYPGKAGGLLPRTIEGVRTVRAVQEAARTLKNPEGSPVKMAFDSMYAVVETGLSSTGLRLLSTDTLRGQVPYLLGYPLGSASEVAATGGFDRALDVELYVEVPDQVTGSYSILGTGKSRVSGHPEMTLKVRMVDATGQLLWRESVRVRSKEKIELNERWLLGIRRSSEGPDASSLPALTRQAMDKLLARRQQISADVGATLPMD